MAYNFWGKTRVVFLFMFVFPYAHIYAQGGICLSNRSGGFDSGFPFAAMDSLLHPGNCDAFFYGETHTRYFEPMFKLHLVKMLHSEQGIRDVFMEMGFAPAVVFNKFLETGDTSLINIKVLYTTPYYMEFWKQLHRYNKALPEDKKIRIHGVDFEATTAFFHALLLLVPDHAEIPEALNATFRKLRAYSAKEAMNPKEFTDRVKEIKNAFHAHQDQIPKLYGANYRMVNKIFDNDITMTDKLRDKKMYRHMQTVLTENNITRFVGFFGGDHVNYEYKTSLPDQLIEGGMLKDKVLTIRGVYFDAFDNWSRETVECIGVYDEKDGHTLHERYRDSSCRAILIPSGSKDDILKNSADFYLFVDDKARP